MRHRALGPVVVLVTARRRGIVDDTGGFVRGGGGASRGAEDGTDGLVGHGRAGPEGHSLGHRSHEPRSLLRLLLLLLWMQRLVLGHGAGEGLGEGGTDVGGSVGLRVPPVDLIVGRQHRLPDGFGGADGGRHLRLLVVPVLTARVRVRRRQPNLGDHFLGQEPTRRTAESEAERHLNSWHVTSVTAGMRPSRLLKDHYRVLGVSYGATREEIKTAYRTLAKTHHPDANPGNPSSVRRFQAVAEAHSVLSDASLKSKYDRSIGNLPRKPLRPTRTVVAPRAPPGSLHDFDAWRELHYGDESGYSRTATQQVHREGQPKAKAFFDRKVRSTQERKEAQELNAIRAEKDSIVRRLKARRASRRVDTSMAPSSEGASCVVS